MKNMISEIEIVKFFNKKKSKYLDLISSWISNIRLLFLFWIILILLLVYLDFESGLAAFVGISIAFIIHYFFTEGVIKFGAKILKIERARPYLAFPEKIRPIGKNFSDSSFPSSHVASVVGGLFALTYVFPSFLIFSILFVCLISWSRLRNGMHYPSDIAVGILLGLFYSYLTRIILNYLF